MKIVRLENADKFSNSDRCSGLEYSLNDKDINISTATIKGRYPDSGYCVNMKCKELIYVIDGSGSIVKKDETIAFEKEDIILIDKEELYYWNANCKVIMTCTPAWNSNQHLIIEEENVG